jgi:hypothetical protein
VYLNVDLEIRSRSDLTPLVEALRSRLLVLHAGRRERTFFAAFETAGGSDPPDVAIRLLATALRRLPPSMQRLWRAAHDRVFDIGVERGPGTEPLSLPLRQDTMKIVAMLNARLALTFYSYSGGSARRPAKRADSKPARRVRGRPRAHPARTGRRR